MVEICGIDDSGRGPIIGPMVIAGATIDELDIPNLEKLGVKDSKLLTRKKRDELYNLIIHIAKKYKIIIIQPAEIDKFVNPDNGSNLNWLEAEKMADIINDLKPTKVIVDCPSPNIKAFHTFLKKKIIQTELICDHKAERFIPVAAASILAKVTRDNSIDELKRSIGIDFGSGYPSDPKTQEFTLKYYNIHPNIFRKSWAPYKQLQKSNSQSDLSKFT